MKLDVVSKVLVCLVIPSVLLACGGGGSSGGQTGSTVSKVVDRDAGGTLEITDPSSPMYGAKVEIPPGALTSPQETISMSVEEPPSQAKLDAASDGELQFSSKLLVLKRTGTESFNVPVTVTLPYDKSKGDFVLPLDIDEASNTFESHEISSIADGKVSFPTAHFSSKGAASGSLDSLKSKPIVVPGFDPRKHGFFIPNFRTTIPNTFSISPDSKAADAKSDGYLDGVCYGMVAISKWFFEKKPAVKLFDYYKERLEELGTDDVIARDFATEVHYRLGKFTAADARLPVMRPNAFYYDMLRVIGPGQFKHQVEGIIAHFAMKKPQIIMLGRYDANNEFKAHAVLGYSVRCGSAICNFEAYDPNHPGQTLTITADTDERTLNYSLSSGENPGYRYDRIGVGSADTFYGEQDVMAGFNFSEVGKFTRYRTLTTVSPNYSNAPVPGTKNEYDVVFADARNAKLVVVPKGFPAGLELRTYLDGAPVYSDKVTPDIAMNVDLTPFLTFDQNLRRLTLVVANHVADDDKNPKYDNYTAFYSLRPQTYIGTYSGTFTPIGKGDSGTVKLSIDNYGVVSGTGVSAEDGDFVIESGQILDDGTLTLGSASTRATFSGKVDINASPWTITGTWNNAVWHQAGNFKVAKE
ncbi:hypothetical protein [Paraburkholderia sp. J63]|uniref:hypothetical protein n=1 Tax=Paraburkholderia sp. J63 TaxID=2805434 RepID=UPI002ABDAD85|nr:hypothetical protein [Paraburkholderia sp. J63]